MTETTSAFRPEIQQSCSNRDEYGNVTENVEELYPFCISKFKHDARNSCCIQGNKVENGRNASVLVLQRVAISYANMGLSSKMAQCNAPILQARSGNDMPEIIDANKQTTKTPRSGK